MNGSQTLYERYRNEIYRIGWKIEYRARKVSRTECSLFDNIQAEANFIQDSENKIMLEQLTDSLPAFEKSILYKLYLEGYSEAEVAKQFNISQQAVNKWKKKIINQLSQTTKSHD
ncbi:sigma-70 family RNA polymerase sigma factor [Paenibacillus tritici]|uniref:Sigma-70 family RNA polymerase sigma factor n=1 Tax=Paenibacillus tritici TaxID=1873425 RepID=A0ABX2DS65_9BACL|nr:sigma-70 family RNA polymerase sigma factor [Paenibacillus tritici]NQX46863.1 sigma-70 family RNA polymerase sigma factor [Paenibacillus tritici]